MLRGTYSVLFAALLMFTLAACNNVPKHVSYLPQNAIVVAGINTKSISKKIAWNMILGSKLLDDMKGKKDGVDAGILDPEKTGIELMSTSYVYVKQDKRFANGIRITAVLPLDDVSKWETYLKQYVPGISIKQQNKHKDATLAEGMYAGWNDDVLIIMNSFQAPDLDNYSVAYEDDSTSLAEATRPAPVPFDEAQLTAEMDNCFTVAPEQSLKENKRFTELESNNHDITIWINYEEAIGQMGSSMNSLTGGLSLSNSLWKDASAAIGFNFEKGRIAGEMHYYLAEEMQQIGKDLGATNADKEMIDRLPANNLDMLMAAHISPKGIKGALEKVGVLGLANLALSGQGITTDDFFDAFTGDMVVSLNDLSLKKELATTDTTVVADSTTVMVNYKSDVNYLYAMKIGKRDKFDKLLQLALQSGMLTKTAANTYTVASGSPVTFMTDDKYLVIANKPENATAYLKGSFKGQKFPEEAKNIYGLPFGMYLDATSTVGAIDPGVVQNPADATLLADTRKLLQDVVMKGGAFKSGAFEYKMNINFVNKEENSLLQLIDFAMKVKQRQDAAVTAAR